MKLPKLLIVGAVALTGLFFATAAQADDHRRHNGDRHEWHHHHDNYRSDYYDQQPGVVYANPGYGYYNDGPYYGSSNNVTIAFGGHRGHRHHHHH